MMSFSEIWNELGRLEELIRIALNKSGSIPGSVAGTGFWRSLAGVLQPTASEGLQGQIAGMNAGGTDIKWQATWDTWVPVSGVFTPAANQIALLVDTTGPQTTITTPANPYDGQMLIVYDYEGGAATNPIILTANTGTTIDDPSFPGNVPGASGHIAQQGMTAIWKFFAGAAQWQLIAVTTPYVATPNSWAQTAWFVDAAAGSDTNKGTTSGSPLKTKLELARRYNGWTPTFNGINVVVTYLSPDTGATDPALFLPTLTNGASFTQIASLPTAGFTGTLNAVTSKNVAGNAIWRSTFNTTTGAIAARMMLVNATRSNSRAFVQVDEGGGNWQFSQPLQPYAANTFPSPTNVDTWQAGDAITGYALMNIDIPKVGGSLVDYNGGFSNGYYVRQLNVWDPTGTAAGPLDVDIAVLPYFIECSCTRAPTLNGDSLATLAAFMNFATNSIFFCTPNDSNALYIAGGFLAGGGFLRGATLRNDAILSSAVNVTAENCQFNEVFVDTSTRLKTHGNCGTPNGSGKIFGPGICDVQFGCLLYSGQTAVSAFPIATLNILGHATAYSNVTTAGSTAVHNLALTAANLDAAAGATGFGGLAYSGAACITNGTQP